MQLSEIIEALLIASQEPLSSDEMARMVRSRVAEAEDVFRRELDEGSEPIPLPVWLLKLEDTNEKDVSEAIAILIHHYQETQRSFALLQRPKGWKIYTRAEYGDFVKYLFPDRKAERLSAPAMETLAIVAYRQPITKAAIEAVRGVSCDGMIQKLLDRELIRIGGRADLPGRPLLYQTTDLFFEHFGISHINDLPNSAELRRIKLPESSEQLASVTPNTQQLALGGMELSNS